MVATAMVVTGMEEIDTAIDTTDLEIGLVRMVGTAVIITHRLPLRTQLPRYPAALVVPQEQVTTTQPNTPSIMAHKTPMPHMAAMQRKSPVRRSYLTC